LVHYYDEAAAVDDSLEIPTKPIIESIRRLPGFDFQCCRILAKDGCGNENKQQG